jgi:DnaJ like chaperone protein
MSWWGKLAGGAFGFMLLGPLGALLGAVIGHNFDKGFAGLPEDDDFQPGDQQRVQMAFFTATFSIMGAVAKADGQVSRDEIRLAEQVMQHMNLDEAQRKAAIGLFNEGKKSGFPIDEVLEQFRVECHRRHNLIQMFIEIQIQAAYADGNMDTAERALLKKVCRMLGFSELVFRQLEQRYKAERNYAGTGGAAAQAMTVKDAYSILGVDSGTSDAEVKKAYRRLISQHHPDKLVSKGLPEEMMKIASEKTHEIKQAYEKIKQHRGVK